MKRIINLLMAVALSVVLVACGGGDNSTEETSVNNEPVNDNFNEEFDYVDMLRQEYGEDVSITDLDEDDLIALEEDEIMELLNDKDRKSTRLNSSHVSISYAVFCLKKKKNKLFCIYY